MLGKWWLPLLVVSVLSGCSGDSSTAPNTPAPWVLTITPKPANEPSLRLAGIVQARHVVPIAFQLEGRLLKRHADAGQTVTAGQLLFSLDTRDLDASLRAAEAQLAVAETALLTRQREVARLRTLRSADATSQQTFENGELAVRDAMTRREAAHAALIQARNARAYAELRAPRAGVLTTVNGEAGQVVHNGQVLAQLALEGEREIEVLLPDGKNPPPSGEVLSADGQRWPLALREVAGAADPQSRSWPARYQLKNPDAANVLALGGVASVTLDTQGRDTSWRIPLGALDERGQGPQVWMIRDGKAQAIPVNVLSLSNEYARIRAELPENVHLVAIGTHLLVPEMAVRERAQ